MDEASFNCPVCGSWILEGVNSYDSGALTVDCNECESKLGVSYSIEVLIEGIDVIEERAKHLEDEDD